MIRMTRRTALGSLASLASLALVKTAAAASLPAQNEIRGLLANRIDTERQSLGMVIGTSQDAERTQIVAYGARSARDARAPDGDGLFNIGSIAKLFTAILLADAVARGEVRYEDPLKRHLPPDTLLPAFGDTPITLLDLATHTAGLPGFPDDFPPESDLVAQARYTREQLFAFLARYRLAEPPGTTWLYSNFNYILIAAALEFRTQKRFPFLLRARVIEPLKLTSTYIGPLASPGDRLVPGHDLQMRELPPEPVPLLLGAGGMHSSARDLLKLVGALAGQRKTSLRAAMDGMLRTHRPVRAYAAEQALGPQIFGDPGQPMIGHAGSTTGQASAVLWRPHGPGVVVLSNAAPPVMDIAFHVLDPTVPLAAPMRSTRLDPTLIGRYVGKFNLEVGGGKICLVAAQGEGLTVEFVGDAPKMDLTPESEDIFTIPRMGARFTFEGQKGSPAQTLRIEIAGTRYTGTRVP